MKQLQGRAQSEHHSAGKTPAPREVRWVLFDAVGTIIYPDPPVAEAYQAAASSFGSRLAVDEIARRFRAAFAAEYFPLTLEEDQSEGPSLPLPLGKGRGEGPGVANKGSLARPPTSEVKERERWQRIVARVIDDVPAKATDQLFEHLWTHFAQPQHWRLFDDVPPALSALASRGYHLGIASNFDRRLYGIVKGHSPLQTFEKIFVSSELGFTKPDFRFFATVTQQLGVAANEIMLVGDDKTADFIGAKAAGWQALRLNRDQQNCEPCSIMTLVSLHPHFDNK